VSAAMPGISPRLSRGSDVRDRARRGAFGSTGSPRSIFGARLRTRWPQYGHSVTYGETSELQFLQTTKRSGSLTLPRIPGLHSPQAGPQVASAVDGTVFSTISPMTSRRSLFAS
jgi:hypothetical protein